MPLLNMCCCCRLRSGAKVLAWWNLVDAVYAIYVAYDVFKVLFKDSTPTDSEDNTWRNIMFLVAILLVITQCAVCYLLFSGVYAKRPANLKKSCIILLILLIMNNISIIDRINKKSKEREDILGHLIGWVVVDAIKVYCLLCTLSYYQELKEEEEGTDDDRDGKTLPLFFNMRGATNGHSASDRIHVETRGSNVNRGPHELATPSIFRAS